MLEPLLALIGGYALGSIPFAYLVTRLFNLGDIRQIGSGNVGTTNVLRTGNKLAAALTLLLAKTFGDTSAMAAALGAFAGHVFPVWLNFKGGKGLATAAGIIAALNLPVFLIGFATWITVALIWRISSLAAFVAAAATPVYMLLIGPWIYAAGAAVLAALIFVTHRDNIRRLLAGEEPRIGEKK
jgi:glycerol-3-phosphate acyltransferase PlsY